MAGEQIGREYSEWYSRLRRCIAWKEGLAGLIGLPVIIEHGMIRVGTQSDAGRTSLCIFALVIAADLSSGCAQARLLRDIAGPSSTFAYLTSNALLHQAVESGLEDGRFAAFHNQANIFEAHIESSSSTVHRFRA
nr:hypothetical protein CFP56_02929 [Quercus suber]